MNDNQELILKGRYTAYMEQIEKYYNGTIDRTQPIVIGMTTNALAISGADRSLRLPLAAESRHALTHFLKGVSHEKVSVSDPGPMPAGAAGRLRRCSAPHAGIPDAASRCGYRGNYL